MEVKDKKNIKVMKRKVIINFNEDIEDIKISLHIKKCANCGKLTIVNNKQKYCEKCKNISYDTKKTTGKIRKVYRTNYKNQHYKMTRNINKDPLVREKFNKWNNKAKEMTKKCEDGRISLDKLKVWFKDSQKWNKGN